MVDFVCASSVIFFIMTLCITRDGVGNIKNHGTTERNMRALGMVGIQILTCGSNGRASEEVHEFCKELNSSLATCKRNFRLLIVHILKVNWCLRRWFLLR